jgi:ATP:ADP antiporter, AAA family
MSPPVRPADLVITALFVRLVAGVLRVDRADARAAWSAFWCFFVALGGYSVLRPVRDSLGAEGGPREMAWNFTFTLVGMLLLTPVYGAVVSRMPRRLIVPVVYRGFAALFVGWWFVISNPGDLPADWVRRGWFVFVSVFNLFLTSVFWSSMADAFRPSQARRLFGFAAAGGTAGAVLAGKSVAWFAESVGSANLIWVEVVALELAVHLVRLTTRRAAEARPDDSEPARAAPSSPTGGDVLAGAVAVARSPFLRSAAAYLAVATLTGTLIYNARSEFGRSAYPTRDARTAAYGDFDAWANGLTLLAQVLLAAPILRRFGAKVPLVALPMAYGIGACVVGARPVFSSVGWTDVTGRSVRHGLATPARETLFTGVSREEKYKAKAFIDTVVYRFGDVVSAWIYDAVRVALDSRWHDPAARLAAMSYGALPIAALWAWVGLRTARLAPRVAAAPDRVATRLEKPAVGSAT